LDLKRTFYKKSIVEEFFFSKFQNGGLNGDGAINDCFFLLALTQPFLSRIQHINPFWTCCNKHFGTLLGPKKIIQNGVNIQDGDFTFSYQSA
jgi:hypothetical protein